MPKGFKALNSSAYWQLQTHLECAIEIGKEWFERYAVHGGDPGYRKLSGHGWAEDVIANAGETMTNEYCFGGGKPFQRIGIRHLPRRPLAPVMPTNGNRLRGLKN